MSVFDRAPHIVIWETTRACALACVHCRAEAMPHRNPDELTTAEGRHLIDRVTAFGPRPPVMVLTGGDPLRRPDLAELVAYGTERGVAMSLTPSATGAATRTRLAALRDAGLARLAVSLDAADAEGHDAFRRVRGSHRRTLAILDDARALGLPLQINTTVCRQTVRDLPRLAEQVAGFGVTLWALFFLIPVGRAEAGDALDAQEIERVLAWAADLSARVPFGIKTTEAPHFHRVLAARKPDGAALRDDGPGIRRAGRAVTDGNGIVFIDHVGQICPSGFVPIVRGNVRVDDVVGVYRTDPVFQALRDPVQLGGRCGVCEYRGRCGGSRARAYAASGDVFGEDPGCAWQPATPPVIAGGSDVSVAPAETAINEALRTVLDPEVGLSILDMGLVYGVAIEGGSVRITMTLTASGCPLGDVMTQWVRAAVGRVPGVEQVEVVITFDPPWTPDRMAARR